MSEIRKYEQTQLTDQAILQRFAVSRQALASDPYRPLYHFVSPEGNLNDPNGLCYWQGQWHLFYQAFPPENPIPPISGKCKVFTDDCKHISKGMIRDNSE